MFRSAKSVKSPVVLLKSPHASRSPMGSTSPRCRRAPGPRPRGPVAGRLTLRTWSRRQTGEAMPPAVAGGGRRNSLDASRSPIQHPITHAPPARRRSWTTNDCVAPNATFVRRPPSFTTGGDGGLGGLALAPNARCGSRSKRRALRRHPPGVRRALLALAHLLTTRHLHLIQPHRPNAEQWKGAKSPVVLLGPLTAFPFPPPCRIRRPSPKIQGSPRP
jgi:hypothetical protein